MENIPLDFLAKEVAKRMPARLPLWHILALVALIVIMASFCNECASQLVEISRKVSENGRQEALAVHEIHLWRRRVEELPK